MSSDEGLSVRELLKSTYDRLAERHPHQEIVLIEDIDFDKLYLNDRIYDPESSQKIPRTKIADDSSHQEMHTVYMGYRSINIFQFGDKTWAIGLGEVVDGYLADPYSNDLLALEILIKDKTLEQFIREKLIQEIRRSAYFRNSLIYGANGGLRVGTKFYYFLWQNPFEERMLELLKPRISRFLAQKPEYDTDPILASSWESPPVGLIRYKPEFVDFLADTIETVLKEQ